jgi:hypothetical protein
VAAVGTDRGGLVALRVPGYVPPTWPDAATPKQTHLDLSVDDLDTAEAEAIRLGRARQRSSQGLTGGGCCSTPPVTPSAFMSTGVVYEVPARFWPVRPGGRVAVT